MGIDHQPLLKKLEKLMGADFNESTIYLYGSQLTGTTGSDSDTDLVILLKRRRNAIQKEVLRKKLAQDNIGAFIVHESVFDSPLCHSFFFAPSLEQAARFGLRIHGNKIIRSRMTDRDLLIGSWVITLFYLSPFLPPWSRPQRIKFLLRGTLVLWCLDHKLELNGHSSLGEFFHVLLQSDLSHLTVDPLWKYVDLSEALWKWIDPSFQGEELTAELLEEWDAELRLRYEKHHQLIDHLVLNEMPADLLDLVKNDALYANIPWQKEKEGRKLSMKDGGQQFLVNFVKICFRKPAKDL